MLTACHSGPFCFHKKAAPATSAMPPTAAAPRIALLLFSGSGAGFEDFLTVVLVSLFFSGVSVAVGSVAV